MFSDELIRQLRLLEIRTDRLVEEFSGGAYRSIFKGQGIEFEEVREYTSDDDVRMIDWNVSARMGEPYVKKFVEERELTVLFLVDISASGRFGSGGKSKRNTAAELAALLAFSAGRNGDRTGLLMFSDRIEYFLPPRAGRRHTMHMISEMLTFEPTGRRTDIALALSEAARLMKKRGVIFLFSDLLDDKPFDGAMKLLTARHDLIAVEITDPAEISWPVSFPLEIEDAESGEAFFCSTSPAQISEKFRQLSEAKEKLCRECRADLIRIGGSDMLKGIIEFFSRRKKSGRR